MMKKQFCFIVFILLTLMPWGRGIVFARGAGNAVFVKAVKEAGSHSERIQVFEELKDEYFSDNRYAEFIQRIQDSFPGNRAMALYVNYYTALARYQQLAYLEKTQKWDEYFDQGNEYKAEIENNARKVVENSQPDDPLNINGRVLLWRFHREQQDPGHQEELQALLKAVQEYAQTAEDMSPLKNAGDSMLLNGEKTKAEGVYRLYAEKLALTAGGAEEVRKFARRVYREGNREFSQVLYTAYIDHIAKTYPLEQVIADLNEIADLFISHRESIPYVVKIYDRTEAVGGNAVFTEPMMLKRAFALVQAKEYRAAKEVYQDFIKKYPCSGYYDEALFKLGVIYTYVLRDRDKGRLCFEQVAQKDDSVSLKECGAEARKTTPWFISSLYHLGLLSQWDKEPDKAAAYYTQLQDKAKGGFRDTVRLANERLKEIKEGNPIEYGLRLFLDASLKPENERFDMSRIDLSASVINAKGKENVRIFSNYSAFDTGSLQPEVQYLWSGDTGTATSSFEASVLDTSYEYGGTKTINLVVVSPQGVLDRGVYLLDVE